jgi:hypothetical protein
LQINWVSLTKKIYTRIVVTLCDSRVRYELNLASIL